MFRNLHLKLFALGLAILFWVFVVSIENVFMALPEEIPVNIFNLREDLAVSSELPKVKITVRAESTDIFRRLRPTDFEAYVDLKQAGAGDQEVSVSVTSKNPEVRVSRVSPSEIRLSIEPIRETVLPLILKIDGIPAKNFEVVETRASHPSIRVKAAESLLRKSLFAEAWVKLEGKEEKSFEREAKIVIVDESRDEVSNVIIGNERVVVFTRIEAVMAEKELPVHVSLDGKVPEGSLKKAVSNPEAVTIAGPQYLLDQITTIETEPFDLSKVSSSGTFPIRLNIPEGISIKEPSDGRLELLLEIVP